MSKTTSKRHASLGVRLSTATLAIAAMAPLPAALAPLGGVSAAHAQSNPCAPTPPKSAPANPCAPQKSAPANPCAPQAARPANPCAPKAGKGKKDCDAPKNPCAPAPKCDEGGQA
jgi:hypothetical protein